MKFPVRLLTMLAPLLVLCAAVPAYAQTYSQDFEKVDSSYFDPLELNSAAGSSIAVVSSRAHGGKQPTELSFKFSNSGFIGFSTGHGGNVAAGPGTLHVSLWIHGAGTDALAGGALRLIDSGNEVFQYRLGDATVKALAGSDWTHVQEDLEVTKFNDHWGQKNTGAIQYPLRFFGFAFSHAKTDPAAGSVGFDDLVITGPSVAPSPQASGPMQITLQNAAAFPGLPSGFYPMGASIKERVALINPPPGNKPKVDWIVRDLRGKTVAQPPPGASFTDGSLIQFPAATPGILYVTATARDSNGAEIRTIETRYAVLAPRVGMDAPDHGVAPIRYGVCARIAGLSPEETERTASVMDALGFRSCRTDVDWMSIEPQPGVWNWSAYDSVFAALARHGITPCGLLAYSAQWASTGDPKAADWTDWAYAPPRPQDFAQYAQKAAQRYGKETRYWEIWNEEDNGFWRGTVSQYATLFDAASVAIKRVQPDAVVMNGGFSEVRLRPTYIPDFSKGVRVKPDVMAYHSHGPLDNLLRADAYLESARHAAGWSMPKWLNEAGIWSSPGSTEYDQAVALVQKMSYAPALGDAAYFWYDLRNNGDDPANVEDNFGLVRNDFTPKAAALAAYNLINVLGGLHFVRLVLVPGAPTANAILYSGGKRPRTVLVAWTPDPGAVPLMCALPGAARQVDIMGVSRPLVQRHGLANVTLTTEPTYLAFDGTPGGFTLEPSVLAFDKKVSAVPGENTQLSVTVRNPFNASMASVVRFTAPQGWSVVPSQVSYGIAPRGQRVFRVAVTPTAAHPTATIMPIQLHTPLLPDAVDGRIDLRPATPIRRVSEPSPLGQFDPDAVPTVILSQPNLVSLYEATPMGNLHFHGDADLSAGIMLTRTPDGLRLSAVVHDDVFSQSEPPGQEWQGDSLQFAIVLPSREQYEWLAALRADGPAVVLNLAPPGVPIGDVKVPVRIRRDEALKETLYDLVVPDALPGGRTLPNRFAFDVLANDNDGDGRKGWVEWTPGIGRSKDPSDYHEIVIR